MILSLFDHVPCDDDGDLIFLFEAAANYFMVYGLVYGDGAVLADVKFAPFCARGIMIFEWTTFCSAFKLAFLFSLTSFRFFLPFYF